MDALTLSTLAQMSGASLLAGNPDARALRVCKDTRTLLPGDLYVALRGERFDGNQYLQEAAAKGAVAALCDGDAAMGLPSGFGILSTADALSSLALLASHWRSRLTLRSVVITGSSGKTSTKDFATSVLGHHFRTTGTEGNLNNHIGLPLSILAANSSDEAAVWEIGMNHRGEIAPLAGLAKPDIAIITGIGTAHIEYLGSREAIALEKGDLLEALTDSGIAILPAHDDFVAQLRARTRASVLEVGFEQGNLRATHLNPEAHGSSFVIEGDYGTAEAFVPVPGKHMVGNALLAVAAGLVAGVSLSECVDGLASSRLTGGRLGKIERRGVILIDDTYNANPESMIAALETLSSLPGNGKRIAVLGRMGELGDHALKAYDQVGKAAARNLGTLICVGTDAAAIAESAKSDGLRDIILVSDTKEAATVLSALAQPGDQVLIKASRTARMEEVINNFQ